MDRTRILAIIPYEGMREQILAAVQVRDDVEVEVYLGDLEEGVQVYESVWRGQYDAVLSRGRTARMIEQVAEIPVVEVRISGYDLLRVLRLTENYSGKYAIVGFPNIMREVNVLCDLLQYKADIFTTYGVSDLQPCIEALAEEKYSLVIGDVAAVRAAKLNGLNGILITSGAESIGEALDNAVRFARIHSGANKELSLLREITTQCGALLMAVDSHGEILFRNFEEKRCQHLADLACSWRDMEDSPASLLRVEEGVLWRLENRLLSWGGIRLWTMIRLHNMGQGTLPGVTVQSVGGEGSPGYQHQPGMGEVVRSAVKMGACMNPVLIQGETGVDKDAAAHIIHHSSLLNNATFITVDCALVPPDKLCGLLGDENSLLRAEGLTVLFRSIDSLAPEAEDQLLEFLQRTIPSNKSKFIFSIASQANMGQFIGILEESYDLLQLYIPPLREHPQDIPSMVSLHLGDLSIQLGQQVIGLEPEAMRLMQHYPWDGNTVQLHRVLRELVLEADSSFLSREAVERKLHKERASRQISIPLSLDTEKSLDEMTSDFIMAVLEEENMNQTKAAERLKISRSTLWRKLREIETSARPASS